MSEQDENRQSGDTFAVKAPTQLALAARRPITEEGESGTVEFTGRLPLFTARLRTSRITREWQSEDFYSDKSRIVFCSSFRRMMQKAQVFSLESNTSVRNRLTHSLEVADIGRTLARHIGKKLEARGIATEEETECMQSIVENACLLHDIGNPPFGHFGEEAIKKWFRKHHSRILTQTVNDLKLNPDGDPRLFDFQMFDGNPQGFRIVSRLHWGTDEYGLNLTFSTLLASVKYPNCGEILKGAQFGKKLGVFSSERDIYQASCRHCGVETGRRYFLAYVMELADDICYCLSDIADSFEKRITTSREFKAEFKKICDELSVDSALVLPEDPIENFSSQISIVIARRLIGEAAELFASKIETYVAGTARELSEDLPSGKVLKCFKTFARRFIYTDREAERIEIAGSRIVTGLLDHFGTLLDLTRSDFEYFVEKGEMRKGSGLDTEWRIFKQLSPRMMHVYRHCAGKHCTDDQERLSRARLIVDFISGLTDNSALSYYQNFMGISL